MRILRLAMILVVPFMVAAAGLSSGCSTSNEVNGAGGSFVGIGGGGGHIGVGGATGAGGATGDASTAAAVAEISIQNFTFVPNSLTVPAGTTITIRNLDPAQHTVTSEAAMGQLVPGAVNGVSFDTGIIGLGANTTIVIPANAPSGTVIPFFCKIHTNETQGTITIQ